MPNPKDYDALENKILTGFALDYQSNIYVNRLIHPPVNVTRDVGTYYVGKNGMFLYDTERALRAMPKQIDQSFGTGQYHTRQHALDHPLDMEELKAAEETGMGQVMNLKQRAVNYVMNSLELDREHEDFAITFGTAYYGSSNKADLSSTHGWDEQSDSNPISDINAAIEACRAGGARANSLVLDYMTLSYLLNHPVLIGYFKNQMGMLTIDQMKSLFPTITKVVVTDAVYNSGTPDVPVLTPLATKVCAVLPIHTPQEMQNGVRLHSAMFEKVKDTKSLEYSVGPLLHLQQYVRYGIEAINDNCGFLFTNTFGNA